jgi:hypothetical protein
VAQGRQFCSVAGICPPDPCLNPIDIVVDDDHEPENMTLGFWGGCTPCDMNYDDMCTMVYDIECFVQCVYYGDCIADANDTCTAPDGADLCCPADVNCDGMCTMVYDVEDFVNCVYYGAGCGCSASGREAIGMQDANGITIGGAVYDDETDPLFSGVEGTTVDVVSADGTIICSTTTRDFGTWLVEDVPAGTYTVVFGRGEDRVANERNSIDIVVNAGNEAANQRIKWVPRGEASPILKRRRVAPAR